MATFAVHDYTTEARYRFITHTIATSYILTPFLRGQEPITNYEFSLPNLAAILEWIGGTR